MEAILYIITTGCQWEQLLHHCWSVRMGDARGKLIGIIFGEDIRRNMKGLLKRTEQAMAALNPVVIITGLLVVDALSVINQCKIGTL